MSELYTAPTYENWERIEEFEQLGKPYARVRTKCDRCVNGVYAAGVHNGALVPHPAYGGVCLKCGGSGYMEKKVRLYTKKDRDKIYETRERRSKARKAELEARARENAASYKAKWYSDNAFGEDNLTYCIFGENTYAIKDKLKELGCKFSPLLKWHSPIPLDLPAGYGMFAIALDDIGAWEDGNFLYHENAKDFVERKFIEAEGPSLSEYVGELGERLRDLSVTYKSCHSFSGLYGLTYIHTFESGDNILVWMTAKELDFEKGQPLFLTGTVKEHSEYRGIKQTKLSRCIIKLIGE